MHGSLGIAGQVKGGGERIGGDTFVGACHRPPSQVEDAKDAFLIPVTPERKLGSRRSISARSCVCS